MKIRAGLKFQGRNPIATPAVIAASSAAGEAGPKTLVPGVTYAYAKNASAAMATVPAARPSSPSMRLTAFVIATTQRTVSGTPRSGPSERIPWPGNQNHSSWTPSRMRMPAASTCPDTFAAAEVPRRSS